MLVETAKINKQEVTVVTSLDIAETFGKEHDHVMRDIRELECSDEFRQSNFGQIYYEDKYGIKQKAYAITRDGFTLLAMGYTGEKAMKFKEAYIKQFNAMERMLQGKLIEREKGIAVHQSFTKALQASRMDSWTERSFSKNITAGVDFMDNVAAQIADYKIECMVRGIVNCGWGYDKIRSFIKRIAD